MSIPHVVYPFIHPWTLGLLPPFGYSESCCKKHGCTNVYLSPHFQLLGVSTQKWNFWIIGNSVLNVLRTLHTVFHSGCSILHSRLHNCFTKEENRKVTCNYMACSVSECNAGAGPQSYTTLRLHASSVPTSTDQCAGVTQPMLSLECVDISDFPQTSTSMPSPFDLLHSLCTIYIDYILKMCKQYLATYM